MSALRLSPVVLGALALCALAACSSSSSSPDAADGGTGSGPRADSGSGGGPEAAVDSSSGGAPCSLPTDCASGDVCCGTIPITGGTAPDCNTAPIETACATPSACKTNLSGFTCMGTKTVRLCKTSADCTETGAPSCCTFGGGDAGGSLTFCASALVAGAGGGTCQ